MGADVEEEGARSAQEFGGFSGNQGGRGREVVEVVTSEKILNSIYDSNKFKIAKRLNESNKTSESKNVFFLIAVFF